jgi:glycosyltransferase EpsH
MIRAASDPEDPSCEEALKNRIAVGLIGVGMRCVLSPLSGRAKRRAISAILRDPVYGDAVRSLNRKPMPLHWRGFFLLAKMRCAAGVYGLLRCMLLWKGKV